MTRSENTSVNYNSSGVWLSGWLFTIGYVKVGFWKGVLALITWPWMLGNFLHNSM